MRQRSDAWKRIVADGNFDVDATAEIGGVEYAAITAPVIDRALIGGGLSVGNCISSTLKLTVMTGNTILPSARVIINARVRNRSEQSEWLEFGTFFVSSKEKDNDLTTITCYDAMKKANQAYDTNTNGWPKTMPTVVQDIANNLGVSPDPRNVIKAYTIPRPEKLSMAQVLGHIAACNGGNWIITPENRLRLVPLVGVKPKTGNPHHPAGGGSVDVPVVVNKITTSHAATISKIVMSDGENTYSAGNDAGAIIQIDNNPYASQTVVNDLYAALNGVVYAPFTATGACYDPCAELGDWVTVGDEVDSVVWVEKATMNTAFRADISAPGADEMNNSYPYNTVASQLAAVVGEFGLLRADVGEFGQIYTDKLNAVEAEIRTLRVEDLEAIRGNIHLLDSDYARIKYLLAGNAHVDVLNSIVLNSDNATIADALIRNGVVNKLTINDLLAADIITNRQRIISNDGSFTIDGSTQTIRDGDGNIRIQLGQDANGNFTFVLYDESGNGVLIDATGIKESAIADGLIKDSKVAEDAAIKGTKLDIASVFTAMNGSDSVLYANHIWFDDRRQTLNQAFSQMSTGLTVVNNQIIGISDTADAASRKADEASKNALDAIRALEGISSLDTLTVWLENDAHVVHTAYDGTGGDYTEAYTVVHVMRGDTEVTQNASITPHPSMAVTGEWDAATATYRVLSMSGNNGYVDFVVSYGSSTVYAVMPDDSYIIFPGDKRLTMPAGTAKLEKRFSISKSPNGQVGLSIRLLAEPAILQRTTEGVLSPATVTFSALTAQGVSTPTAYNGFFRVDETTNYTNYTTKYISPNPESEITFTPSPSTRMIRCSLYATNNGKPVDVQTVTVIADANELMNGIDSVKNGYLSLNNKVTNIETGIDGLGVSLQESNQRIDGITDGNLLWAPYKYDDDGINEYHRARIYRVADGVDVTEEWNDDKYFHWVLRTYYTTTDLGYGVRCKLPRSEFEYGAVLSREFNTEGWPNYDDTFKAYE